MKEIRKSQDQIKNTKNEITKLENTLEFIENILKQKVKSSKGKPKYTMINLQDKLTDLEDSSRSNIIRIDDIKESKNVTWQKYMYIYIYIYIYLYIYIW